MAIVRDLNLTPPGRAGNQIGIDPHNMQKAEYSFHNDNVRTDVSITALVGGSQQILPVDGARNTVTVMNASGNNDVAVGVKPLASVKAPGAHPIFAGNGYTWKGELARQAFYCFGVAGQSLTILVG